MAANFYPNPIADLGGDPVNPTALPAAGLGPDPNAQPLVGNLVNVGPGGGPLVPVIGANPQSAPNIQAQVAGPLFTNAQMQTMTNNAPASVQQEMANANKTPYQTAMEVALRSTDYLQNANVTANKANEFREVAVERLRTIFNRLQSINAIVTNMQQGAAAAQNAQQLAQAAQTALIDLMNAVNSQGYISQNQADAMADLASQLSQLNIPQMMAGLTQQINNLSHVLRAELTAQGGIPPDAVPPVMMTGGRRKRKKGKKTRRKKKKKKHKGGFKYSRIANSRRSLRMTRRKSLRHKKHHKKHNKKHKRTKKHRRRKRR
ncbi:MAG: hypothetical protein H8E55_17560 [Pelagibacterales bacterium]|nr:hypothetical protein [Pelagibacterales bacterium]